MSRSDVHYDVAVITSVGFIEVIELNNWILRFVALNKRLPQGVIEGLNIQEFLVAPALKDKIKTFCRDHEAGAFKDKDPELMFGYIVKHLTDIKIRSKPMFPVPRIGIEL
jgi:hypothetical protein